MSAPATDFPKTKRRPPAVSKTQLLSLQQVEAEYGGHYTTWRDLTIRGVLPTVKLPTIRRILVKRSDVDRLIEASTERGAE